MLWYPVFNVPTTNQTIFLIIIADPEFVHFHAASQSRATAQYCFVSLIEIDE